MASSLFSYAGSSANDVLEKDACDVEGRSETGVINFAADACDEERGRTALG